MELEVHQTKPVAMTDLGPLVAEYQTSSAAYVRGLIISGIAVLMGLLLLFLNLVLIRQNIGRGQWGQYIRWVLAAIFMVVYGVRHGGILGRCSPCASWPFGMASLASMA